MSGAKVRIETAIEATRAWTVDTTLGAVVPVLDVDQPFSAT